MNRRETPSIAVTIQIMVKHRPVGRRAYRVSRQLIEPAALFRLLCIRNIIGRDMIVAKNGLRDDVNNKVIAKNTKYSVSRLMTGVNGNRHINKYQMSINIGINDKANGDRIAATIRAIAVYTFNKKITVPRLYIPIISQV
ncbi:hypothetical protein ACFLT4_02730 [Chloroflexota bacterium]